MRSAILPARFPYSASAWDSKSALASRSFPNSTLTDNIGNVYWMCMVAMSARPARFCMAKPRL